MTTPLLKEYFDLLEMHKAQFPNENVLLLMQVGGFYEAYEVDEPVKRGCARELSDVLRIHLAKKNGKNVENSPWMSGFPLYVLDKHLTRLNDEGYTVAVYEQTAENKQERALLGIYNHIIRHESENEDVCTAISDRRLFGLFVDRYKAGAGRVKSFRYLISMAYVDMSTGYIGVNEQDCEDYHREIQNILLHYSPPELILKMENFSEEECVKTIQNMSTSSSTKVSLLCDEILHNQILGLLQDVYETKEDPLVYLGLDKHASLTTVLTMVLESIKKHDPLLISKLQKPCFVDNLGKYMEYNRDAFLELNIASICERRRSFVQASKQKSLLDILGHGMSLLGRRRLDGMLRRPLLEPAEIIKRQQIIQYFESTLETCPSLTTQSIPDLEWMLLKWKREKLSFRLTGMFLSKLETIYLETCQQYPEFWNDHKYQDLCDQINQWFDLEKMCSEDYDFIKVSSVELEDFQQLQTKLKQSLNKMEETYKEYFKLQSGAEGWFLTCTVKKWEAFQYKHMEHKLYEISKNKSTVRVSFEELDKLSNKLLALESEKSSYVLASFKSISKDFLANKEVDLLEMIHKIAEMDCFCTLAKFFNKHKYIKPSLLEQDDSIIKVQELRHPIHEYIDKDSLFVPYSFQLGGSEEDALGMLLYGMNSSGKSTLLKSLGMCVWLAQCGFFVPAKNLEWTIVSNLYSKIGTYDNLFCGHSTFVAEMSELQYILRKSNSKSLVLCDELTSGTETKSATGIVASSLIQLVQQNILFLFTTHLHTLSKIPEISENPKIKICHFKVCADNQTPTYLIDDIKIRYDRELNPGSGSDLYGIEIARSLGMEEAFINRAFDYRNRIEIFVHESEEAYKTSRYNKNLIMKECEICQSKINLHTHHITPQAVFERQATFHSKNGKFNLLVVCEKCHEKIHHTAFAETNS